MLPSVQRLVFLTVAATAFPSAGRAQLVVHPGQTITHEVVIQPIRVRKNASTLATYLGDAASEAYIKDQIDRAWAQMGIDTTWNPAVEYTSAFAYDGSPGNYSVAARPTDHLGDIVDGAPTPPKSPNVRVINLFFVEIVPGFNHTSENTANGLAFIDSNGIAVHVGTNLPGSANGRDVVASVIAHEIGHNLGLFHYTPSPSNLMYGGNNTSEYLVASQQATVFTDEPWSDGYDLLQPAATPSAFALWASSHLLEGGPGDDDDGDRLSNAFEFLYGSDPRITTPFPSPVATAAGPVWTLSKQADAVADGFDYHVLTGPDPDASHEAGSTGSLSTVLADDDTNTVVRLDAGHPAAFLRVDTIEPPEAAMGVLPPPGDPGPRVISGCGINGCGHRVLAPE